MFLGKPRDVKYDKALIKALTRQLNSLGLKRVNVKMEKGGVTVGKRSLGMIAGYAIRATSDKLNVLVKVFPGKKLHVRVDAGTSDGQTASKGLSFPPMVKPEKFGAGIAKAVKDAATGPLGLGEGRLDALGALSNRLSAVLNVISRKTSRSRDK